MPGLSPLEGSRTFVKPLLKVTATLIVDGLALDEDGQEPDVPAGVNGWQEVAPVCVEEAEIAVLEARVGEQAAIAPRLFLLRISCQTESGGSPKLSSVDRLTALCSSDVVLCLSGSEKNNQNPSVVPSAS